jgi:predicted RNA-binding Zn-ribbon protein involved in translation (DUF1610 family)
MRWFKPRRPVDTREVVRYCPGCYRKIIIIRSRGETVKVHCPDCGQKIHA